MACIYEIRNRINNKVYIGSTVNFKKRVGNHKYELKNGTHPNIYLQHAWDKCGKENFEFNILEDNISNEEKYKKEQEYLDDILPFNDNGYNLSAKAEGRKCLELDEEKIVKIKKLLADKYTVEKISEIFDIPKSIIVNIQELKIHRHICKDLNRIIKNIKFKKAKEMHNEIIEMYNIKYSVKDIANKVGISENSIRKYLKIYEAKLKGKTINCKNCGVEIIRKSNSQKYCKRCSIN